MQRRRRRLCTTTLSLLLLLLLLLLLPELGVRVFLHAALLILCFFFCFFSTANVPGPPGHTYMRAAWMNRYNPGGSCQRQVRIYNARTGRSRGRNLALERVRASCNVRCSNGKKNRLLRQPRD